MTREGEVNHREVNQIEVRRLPNKQTKARRANEEQYMDYYEEMVSFESDWIYSHKCAGQQSQFISMDLKVWLKLHRNKTSVKYILHNIQIVSLNHI